MNWNMWIPSSLKAAGNGLLRNLVCFQNAWDKCPGWPFESIFESRCVMVKVPQHANEEIQPTKATQVLTLDLPGDGALEPQDPDPTADYAFVHMFFYVVALSITIVEMNLFIGNAAPCFSYVQG